MKGKDKKKITVNIIIIIIIIAGLYLFSTYESSNTAIPETPKTDTTIESENNNIIEQHDDHDTPILKELMKDYPRDHAQAGEAVLSYITSQRLNATVQHITLENGLYNVNISLANRDVIVYVTSDKKSFVTGIASVETFIDKSIYNLLKDNKTISVEQAGKIGLGILKAQDQEPSVIQEINIESGLYHVKMESWGRNISIYLTPNGKYIAQGIIPRDNLISNKQPVKETVPQNDRPKGELFVTAHSPYATASEKSFITVMRIFKEEGNIADLNIRFAHFFIQEEDEGETFVQICIREEQPEKYLDYLEKFLKEGNTQSSMSKTRIDKEVVNDCIAKGRAEEYYENDSILSRQYHINSASTLVVNGVESSVGTKSEDSYLTQICDAFISPPDFCSTLKLDKSRPSPGFTGE